MNTITIIKKIELFGILSKFTLFINNNPTNVFYKKKIHLPKGEYELVVKQSFFQSNKLILKLNNDDNITIYVKGSPAGRYGRELSIIVVVALFFYLIFRYFIEYDYAIVFLFPLLLYMLLPVYMTLFERNKKRIMLYKKN